MTEFINTNRLKEISRVEVITKEGRVLVEYGSFEFQLQDEGKTLKIFKNEERN